MAIPSSSSSSAASAQMCSSEPVPIRIRSGSSLEDSRSTYAPRSMASSGMSSGFRIGSPWRLSTSAVGVSVCPIANCQASAVSFASPGRTQYMFGCARRVASCSTGWWVGPSSPRPIESCVNTKIDGISISEASRTAAFM